MSTEGFSVGALVKHSQWGVGIVVRVDHAARRTTIDFKTKPAHVMDTDLTLRSLVLVREDGLEAIAHREPEKARKWAQEAPLFLLAAALQDQPMGVATPSVLRQVVEPLLEGITWSSWWSLVQPALRRSAFAQFGSGGSIRLRDSVDIPNTPLSDLRVERKATTARPRPRTSSNTGPIEWCRWLLQENEGPTPSASPPPAVSELLSTWPADLMARTWLRLVGGMEAQATKGARYSPQVAESWARSVAALCKRWSEASSGSDTASLARGLRGVVPSLPSAQLREDGWRDLASALGGLYKRGGAFACGVSEGLEAALGKADSNSLATVVALVKVMPTETRVPLWADVVNRRLGNGTTRESLALLEALDEADRSLVLERLAFQGGLQEIQPDRVAHLVVAAWENEDGGTSSFLAGSLMSAALAVGAADDRIAKLAGDRFCRMLEETAAPLSDKGISLLVAGAQRFATEATRNLQTTVEQLTQTYEARTRQLDADVTRLRARIDELQVELGKKREVARLDVRRDMLLVIGETLQLLSEAPAQSPRLREDVEAGLSLALQAGGGDVAGQRGEETTFDPRLHTSARPLDKGAPVRITAPAVVVGGHTPNELVLLKAKVAPKEET